MVLPIGDAPNPRGIPIVTYGLIALNVAVFALITVPLASTRPTPGDPELAEYLRVMTEALHGRVPTAVLQREATLYDLFVFNHGFRPAVPSFQALLASMFLHAGFMHLAGNMLFLWIYGDNVEQRLGRVRYLLAYVATGIAATLAHWVGAVGSEMPVVGASGAISGVLGFYFVWFPRNVVRLLWLLPPFVGQVFELPARVVLGFYLFVDNLLPYFLAPAEAGVAHGAHIGGFLAGVAVAWLGDRRAGGRVPTSVSEGVSGSVQDSVAELIDAGRLAEAARAYFGGRETTRQALGAERAVALADWLRQSGAAEGGLAVLRRTAREIGSGPDAADVHLALARMLQDDLEQPVTAYQHLRTVLDLAPGSPAADEARERIAALAQRQKRAFGRSRATREW